MNIGIDFSIDCHNNWNILHVRFSYAIKKSAKRQQEIDVQTKPFVKLR